MDPELFAQFMIEGRDLVQQATDGLLTLEHGPHDAAVIDATFRAIHTLKGSAALFDLAPMRDVLHAAEDILGEVRAGRRGLDRSLVDAMLACVGTCGGWLDDVERARCLPAEAPARGRDLAAALHHAAGAPPDTFRAGIAPTTAVTVVPDDWCSGLVARHDGAVASARAAGLEITAIRYTPKPDCFFMGDDPLDLIRAVPELMGLELQAPRQGPGAPPYDPFTCTLTVLALSAAPREALTRTFRFVSDQVEFGIPVVEVPAEAADTLVSVGPSRPRRMMRVDPQHVDAMLALVGELVVAKNALAHATGQALRAEAEAGAAPRLAQRQAELDRLVGALTGAALQLRLTPLSTTFRLLPRLVRDTAAQLGKIVDFTVRGEEVELDKAVVDSLYEPLLHLLRNALDHGVEPPDRRLAAGKAATGQVRLRASTESSGVVIVVSDDGAGIDPARLRAAARDRNVLDAGALGRLEDAAVVDLIFAPGFSTASAVTAVSGRGVGLDAVRTAITVLGGNVTVSSTPGAGSEFRLSLPRTSMIVDVLTVRVGADLFGVPLASISEVVRVPRDRVHLTGAGQAFVWRDRTVPLLSLHGLLAMLPARAVDGDARVLVATVDGAPVGLEIDAVGAWASVLLRPPEGLLAVVPGLLGTALMGDGRVMMVLDLAELIR